MWRRATLWESVTRGFGPALAAQRPVPVPKHAADPMMFEMGAVAIPD
ncbi:hypothetical protein N8I71_08470 [Roseibacterium sp. SDUM158016]|nr:hypothetical protein [Roseibacterium sp. SDUM158016]MCU4652863.1 hypothetical protein [Roseibacterium sp. SDUM158016]